jgi:hypothetical protein
MFDSNWGMSQAAYLVIVVAAIAAIVVYLRRAFRRPGERPWPVFFVGLYNILLLIAYLFGLLTQVSSEELGFIPLWVLTMPWSGLVVWLVMGTDVLDSAFLSNSVPEVILGNIAFLCNIVAFVLPAVANSCILYFLLKRHQKKAAEDEAWEQARRNR